MRKTITIALLFLVVLPAFAKDDVAKIKAAIAGGYKQWIAAANRKDAAGLAALYDQDAVLLPPREKPQVGKAAIAEWYKHYVADPRFVPFTETFDSNSFHVVGDIAIDTSDFDGDATRNGKTIHFHGKNLVLWKKQKDGSWKIFRDMWDEIPPKK
jgi:uncharacterized protein (TIGR02246 family)